MTPKTPAAHDEEAASRVCAPGPRAAVCKEGGPASGEHGASAGRETACSEDCSAWCRLHDDSPINRTRSGREATCEHLPMLTREGRGQTRWLCSRCGVDLPAPAGRQTTHEPWVQTHPGNLARGGCSCGWEGPWQSDLGTARDNSQAHAERENSRG